MQRLAAMGDLIRTSPKRKCVSVRRNIMWILISILLVIIAFSVYIMVQTFIENRNYQKKYRHIFQAHKNIGFPKLTITQQFDILDNEDLSYVKKLGGHDFVPTGILDNYINLKPEVYFEHLKKIDLLETMKFDPKNLSDGFFIQKSGKDYFYLFVERQSIVFKKKFTSYNSLLKYLAHHRLSLYAPKKYWLSKILKYCA